MSMVRGTAAFRWREDDAEFVQGIIEDLRDLGLRPVCNTLFSVTDETVTHTLSFEVLPGLADQAAAVLAGVADAGGEIHIAFSSGAVGHPQKPELMRWETVDNATAMVSGAWRLTTQHGIWSLSRDGGWLCDYASEAKAKAVAETAEKAHQQQRLD